MASARLSAAECRALLLDPEGYVLRHRRSLAWTKLERLMLHSKDERVQFAAAKEMLSRIDPVPREPAVAIQDNRRYTWIVPSPLPSSVPRALNGTHTNGSNGSTSSSAIEDGGKPDWL